MGKQAWVNRAHGPTKENNKILTFFGFFRPTQKMGPDGPKWGQEDFSLLIQTLPILWAERILILRNFIFWIFLGPKFPDFSVPDFQISRNLAWAQLGPSLGPAWAHLGPGLSPPWAQGCLLYTSPSPRDRTRSRMPSSA